MTTIKPINDKVSIFATDQELEAKLTKQEIMLIKLTKLEEFAEDLFRSHDSEATAKLFPPDQSWFKIKQLLRECRKLNK
jgi:hypothetical protein